MRRLRSIAVRVALLTALVVATWSWRGPLVRAVGFPIVRFVTGYAVATDDLAFDAGSLDVAGLHVERDGLPLFDVAEAHARFDPWALAAGRIGRGSLLALDLRSPRLTLTRRHDGGFGFARGSARAPASPAPGPRAPAAPLDLDLHVRDGTIVVADGSRRLPESRRLTLRSIAGAIVTEGARTTGRLTGSLDDADAAASPLSVDVDDDAAAGASVVRVRAVRLPIRAPLDYVINAPSARVGGGTLRDLDLRFYAFRDGPSHVSGEARLAGASIAIPGLLVPLRALDAEIGVADGAVTFRRGTAALGEAGPIRLAGGIYDLASPRFDVGLALDRADLGGIARLFAFSSRLPVAGAGRVHVGLVGPVGAPLVAIGLALPSLAYGRVPLRDAAGAVVYEGASLQLAGVRARFGAVAVGVDGAIRFGKRTHFDLAAVTTAPAAGLPYLAAALPLATTHGVGLLTGTDRALETRGVLDAAGPSGELAGLFQVDPSGVGSLGPLVVRRSDGGDLAGAFLLDRRDGTSGFWLDARDVDFADGSDAALPGFPGFRAPRFSGRFDGDLAGATTRGGFRLRGHLHGRDVATGAVRLADVDADVDGAFDRLTLGGATADGAFGRFAGTGSYAGGVLALDGRYSGTFERLRPFTGDLGARGAIDGGVALAIGPHATFVQARSDRTSGARVRGVPLEGMTGSLLATARGVRVYAARLGLAGGRLEGAGASDAGLALSLASADAARLGGTGLRLDAGRLSGFGTLTLPSRRAGAAPVPGLAGAFDGGFGLREARVSAPGGALAAAASGLVRVSGTLARFAQTNGTLSGTPADVDGSVFGIGAAGGGRYDLDVTIASAEAGPYLARYAGAARGDEATVGGRLHVGGTALAPFLRGHIEVPEGEVHGLAFAAGSAEIVAAPRTLFLRRGTVLVGSTRLAFSGGERGDDGGLRVASRDLHLADFDDYFDEGDTLAGDGSLLVRFRRRRGEIVTMADTQLRDVRYRSFELGDATLGWNATGSRVTGRLAFGGRSGTLDAAGSVDLTPHVRLERLLETSRFDGSAHLRDLDLGVWLPAIGLQLPVTGRLDGDARVRGRYPGFDLATTATLRDGTLDHLPVTTFRIAADSTLSRTRITSARLVLPGLALTGSGVVGLGPRGTVDVRVHGASDDIGVLALRLGTGLPVTGAGEVDVRVDGPRTRPRIAGGFDFERAMAGPIAVPRALGEFQVQGRDFVLSDAEVAFARSTLYLAGSLPLTIAPFGFGPAQAPITLELQTKDLELSDFAPLLPAASTLSGRIDGRVRIAGTAGAPTLTGSLSLANGSLSVPLETVPIAGLGAHVTFSGRRMTLESLRGTVGGGALSGDGSASFADLVHPGADATYAFSARGERIRLDLPAYGRGTVDGDVKLSHAPGAPPRLSGVATLNDAVIPFAALYVVPQATAGAFGGGGPIGPPAPSDPAAPHLAPEDLALALDVTADKNVRVRSGNVDIGSRGSLSIRGTRDAPILDGSFDSTGGTLTYFNTLFRVQRGTVTFQPDAGLVPTLDARATSHVSAPDPRNLSGSADVNIDLSGPVTNLNIQLSSDPAYSRDQILGLLFSVPAIGDASLLNGQAVPIAPAGGAAGSAPRASTTSDFSVGQEAFGVLNAQFTRNLLAPFESALSGALDLSDLNVNVDYTGQVGFTARRTLGKKVAAVFGESFGYPEQRQSFGFEYRPNDRLGAQVTAFQSIGQQLLGVQTPNALLRTAANPRLTGAQPIGGTSGFSLSLQRLF